MRLMLRLYDAAQFRTEHPLERVAPRALSRVTVRPRWAREAATSNPMKLAPMIAARLAVSVLRMIARLSASERSVRHWACRRPAIESPQRLGPGGDQQFVESEDASINSPTSFLVVSIVVTLGAELEVDCVPLKKLAGS